MCSILYNKYKAVSEKVRLHFFKIPMNLNSNVDIQTFYLFILTVGENIIAVMKMQNNFWYPLKMSFLQYCDSNILLFSIAPHLVVALSTF